MPNLTGKITLITGASSGIGAGTAIYFAKLGSVLSISGRDESALNQTKLKCIENGLEEKNIVCTIADLSTDEGIKKVFDATIEHFGKLDILVNCAGIGTLGQIESTPIDVYDKTMTINCRSIVQLTQLCIPYLVKTKGSIVNVSSINGICSFPGLAFYNMSKAALDQFTKCLALELASRSVRVNSVNPGVIVTNVQKRAGLTEEQYEKFLEHSKTTHALGRVGNVDEVAKAIGFLASDDASFTTGELFRIDGGRGLMAPR